IDAYPQRTSRDELGVCAHARPLMPALIPPKAASKSSRRPSARARQLRAREIALGLDLPARGDGGERGVQLPAVGRLGAFVFEACTLQGHASLVLADCADRPHLLGREDAAAWSGAGSAVRPRR